MNDEPVEILSIVTGAFDELGIEYAVSGAVAASFHGEPRATNDIDVVAAVPEAAIPGFVGRLEREFFVQSEENVKAVRSRGSFNLIHLATNSKVDVFIKGAHSLDDPGFARRVEVPLSRTNPRRFQLFSAEDIILRKLDWHRRGGGVSDRQWRDVVGILKTGNRALDRDYLQTQAERLGLQNALARASEEAGLS